MYSLNIAFTIKYFPTQLAVRQNAVFKRTKQVVFWGTRNVFGVPKLPIGILPSKVRQNWWFYDKNMPIALLMIIQKRSLHRIVTNVTTPATELKYTKYNSHHIFARNVRMRTTCIHKLNGYAIFFLHFVKKVAHTQI